MVRRGYVPEHWTWRDGPVEPGPSVLIDIDGVLSDAATRQHYIEAPRRDWRGFFDACGDDPVIEEVRVMLDLLDRDVRVILLTARPQRVHELTEAWLRRYHIRWDVLLMRPWGDYELSRDFKQSSLWDLRDYGFEVLLGIEDDRRNVEMLRAEGVPTLYRHSRLLRLTSRAPVAVGACGGRRRIAIRSDAPPRLARLRIGRSQDLRRRRSALAPSSW